MQNDFDHLDVPVNKTDPQENEEPMLLEVDTDIVTENEDMESEKEETQEEKEMKPVTLSIWRTSKSHGSCIVCPVADSTSMRVLSDEQWTMIFLSRSIWVPKGARCCSNHLYKGHLSYEVRQLVKQSKHAGSLDFDDPGALENETYKIITGFDRNHFNDLLDKLTTMRNSGLRSVRMALAIFLAKIRLALSNRVLAWVFRLASKRSVSRICHQVRVALMQDFVPYHVGFQHVSRETILAQHQTTVTTELLTNGRDQVVLIAGGTYFFCQKSSNNEIRRRTYSQHKHRHLVMLMIITASRYPYFTEQVLILWDGYIISSLWPFFTDSLNKDAVILKHCILNNEQQVLSWLRDNDVLALDCGFRDTVRTLNRLDLQVAMPGCLHNKKQLPADEVNRTRFVTKNRWVIESGSYQIRMAKSYIIEHIRQSRTNEEEMEFRVELCNEHEDLVRARFQSRHSNNKKHIATVQFDNHKQQSIDACYTVIFIEIPEMPKSTLSTVT
ncbi:unnamed protein product [Rotaria magnacalcarata]